MAHRHIILVLIFALLLPACTSGVQSVAPVQTPVPTTTRTPTVTFAPTGIALPTDTALPTSTFTPWTSWYTVLDLAYGRLNYQYALVKNESARVYPSLKAASNGSPNYSLLPKNPAYVAILDNQSVDGKSFAELESGKWMDAADLQFVSPSIFAGILLNQPVDFRFGWVLRDTESIDAADAPVHLYSRYEVIREVPSRIQRPGYISVGDDEWLPEDALALTDARVPQEAGRYQCRFIHVDLAQQILRAYDDCLLVFATLVSTGANPAWTPPGWFYVNHKDEDAYLNSPQDTISTYYLESVPYFMSYYGDLGLHGVYWHNDFGTPVSHGCINLSPADSRWLYEWAGIGELVLIGAGT